MATFKEELGLSLAFLPAFLGNLVLFQRAAYVALRFLRRIPRKTLRNLSCGHLALSSSLSLTKVYVLCSFEQLLVFSFQ